MISALYTAQSGLNVSQSAIDNISNNIANANTEGYKKRISNISELSSLNEVNITRGVSLENISRITNEYMYNNLVGEESTQAYLSSFSEILSDVESIFSETDDSGLSNDLNNFFQAIENLRSDPTNVIYQNNVTTYGENLVDTISNIYYDLEREQSTIQTSMNQDISKINEILNQIGDLNKQLGKTSTTNAQNDLLDKRDSLEQELSKYIDIEVDRNEPYQLKIGGEVAVRYDTNIHEVKIIEEYIAQEDFYTNTSLSSGNNLTLTLNKSFQLNITTNTSNQQIADSINSNTDFASTITASIDKGGNLIITSNTKGENGSFNLEISNSDNNEIYHFNTAKSQNAEDIIYAQIFDEPLTISSGSLKTQIESLNTKNSNNYFEDYKSRLNSFVSKLSDLTTTSSGNSLFSGSDVKTFAFNANTVTSLSISDLENLSNLQWDENIDFGSGTSSLATFISQLRTTVAADKENIDYKLENQEAIVVSLTNSYSKLTSVDSDEEMINLMQFQAAYEASAKIITVVDEMLQTILAMKS